LLRYLQNEITLAESAIEQDAIAARGNPQLTLGSRRERGDRFSPYTDSVNLSLTIPIGGKSYVSSRSSSARRQKVDMEVQYRNTQRSLQMALHDVEHEIELVAAATLLATEQARLGEQRRLMAQSAFAEGELTLLQTLPAVQEALAATRD